MKLHRAWYATDTDNSDPNYEGSFSVEIPDPKKSDREIVGVNWSKPGWVEVTYLLRGM